MITHLKRFVSYRHHNVPHTTYAFWDDPSKTFEIWNLLTGKYKKKRKKPCSFPPLHLILSSQGPRPVTGKVYRYIFLFEMLLYLCGQSLNYSRLHCWKGTHSTKAAWIGSLIHSDQQIKLCQILPSAGDWRNPIQRHFKNKSNVLHCSIIRIWENVV